MGLNFLGNKKNNTGADVTQIKKNTNTADSIISQAVSQAGNISNMTLSKDEQAKMLAGRHKIPVQIVALKYFSLVLLALTIVIGLLLKLDLDPQNSYLGILGMSHNTSSKHTEQSQFKNKLDQEVAKLNKEITSLKSRRDAFDNTKDEKKVSLLVPEILQIEDQQKRWFNEVVEVTDPDTDRLVEKLEYGLIDSFGDMIEYFEDQKYQPRFFTEKNRNQSLSTSEPGVCNKADNKLSPKELALKKQYEAAGKCSTSSTLIMANELEIRGLNISGNSANVTVTASDLLSRVFTVSSEFVAMMNSFPFYKGAEVTNFTRRELPEGGDSSEVALRLEFQEADEDDPYDQYLVDLQEWQKNWKR